MRRPNFCGFASLPNSSVVIVSDHMFYWQIEKWEGVRLVFGVKMVRLGDYAEGGWNCLAVPGETQGRRQA